MRTEATGGPEFAFACPAGQLLTFVFGMFLAKVVFAGRRAPTELAGAVALTIGAYFVTASAPDRDRRRRRRRCAGRAEPPTHQQ